MSDTVPGRSVGAAGSQPRFTKRVSYVLQGLPILAMVGLFRLVSPAVASAIGGWVGRRIGPLLPKSQRAVTNLRRTFPEKSDDEIATIVRGMWDNLFRTAAEFVHLPTLLAADDNRYVEIVGEDKYRTAREQGQVMGFTGHFANWEVSTLPMVRSGGRVGVVYRRSNNPIVERLVSRQRGHQNYELLPKGRDGAVGILRLIKAGGQLGILVDQKLNEGIAVPFLGRDAMTSTAPAELAYKYGLGVIPVRPERLKGCKFRVTLFDPILIDASADRESEVRRITIEINRILGEWIVDRPEQWMWLHRRWPDGT